MPPLGRKRKDVDNRITLFDFFSTETNLPHCRSSTKRKKPRHEVITIDSDSDDLFHSECSKSALRHKELQSEWIETQCRDVDNSVIRKGKASGKALSDPQDSLQQSTKLRPIQGNEVLNELSVSKACSHNGYNDTCSVA